MNNTADSHCQDFLEPLVPRNTQLLGQKSFQVLVQLKQNITFAAVTDILAASIFWAIEFGGSCRSSLILTVRHTFLSSSLILGPFTKEYHAITEKVLVVTADGRTLTGTLLSCDQLTNLVLQNTIERVIRPHDDPEDSEEVSHGLYLIRGENVAICGLLDEQMDSEIDWARVKGSVIGGVKHT